MFNISTPEIKTRNCVQDLTSHSLLYDLFLHYKISVKHGITSTVPAERNHNLIRLQHRSQTNQNALLLLKS